MNPSNNSNLERLVLKGLSYYSSFVPLRYGRLSYLYTIWLGGRVVRTSDARLEGSLPGHYTAWLFISETGYRLVRLKCLGNCDHHLGQLSMASPGVAKSSTSFGWVRRESHRFRMAGDGMWFPVAVWWSFTNCYSPALLYLTLLAQGCLQWNGWTSTPQTLNTLDYHTGESGIVNINGMNLRIRHHLPAFKHHAVISFSRLSTICVSHIL